jgi:hypothetical protein
VLAALARAEQEVPEQHECHQRDQIPEALHLCQRAR